MSTKSGIYQLLDLRGRTAVVTGAAGNLGVVIANVLGELGAKLLLLDSNEIGLLKVSRETSDRHMVEVIPIVVNLENQESRDNAVARIRSITSDIDILINNAAFIGDSKLDGWNTGLSSQSIETWRRAIEVNLTSIFDVTKNLSPAMGKKNSSTIINISSIYGSYGPDWSLYEGENMGNPAAYSASKAGLNQLTRWLATTLAPSVRVNSISPGGILRGQSRQFIKRYEKKTPLGRMATEEDFKGIIAYLASDLSLYCTGQDIKIDGGWGVW